VLGWPNTVIRTGSSIDFANNRRWRTSFRTMPAFYPIRVHVSRDGKVIGEDKAKMVSCLRDGRGPKEINLSCRRDVFGSAIGGAGSPAIARKRKCVPGCD
jgi:hypothetical protein